MTSPSSDTSLVERLRARTFSRWESDVQAVVDYEDELSAEAADRIEALEARNRELEAGLRRLVETSTYGIERLSDAFEGKAVRDLDEALAAWRAAIVALPTDVSPFLSPSPTGDRK